MGYIKRNLEKKLTHWQQKSSQVPLCIFGPRRVGKTTLCLNWIKESYTHYGHLDFEKDSQFKHIFSQLNTDIIIDKLEQCLHISLKDNNTIIFLDHIDLFPRAIVAVHLLSKHNLNCSIMMTGNKQYYGFKKVYFEQFKKLYCGPISFAEFLTYSQAENEDKRINLESFSLKAPPSESQHHYLMTAFNIYLSLGGLPSVIKNHCENNKFHKLIENNPGYKAFYFSKKKTATIPIQDQHNAYFNLYQNELKNQSGSQVQFNHDNQILKSLTSIIGKKTIKKQLNPKTPQNVDNSLNNLESIHFLTGIQGVSQIDNTKSFSSYKRYYLPDLSLLHSLYAKQRASYNRSSPNKEQYQLLLKQFIFQELMLLSPKSQLSFWFRDKKSSKAYIPFISNKSIAIYMSNNSNKPFYPSLRLFKLENNKNKTIVIADHTIKSTKQSIVIPPYLISKINSLIDG